MWDEPRRGFMMPRLGGRGHQGHLCVCDNKGRACVARTEMVGPRAVVLSLFRLMLSIWERVSEMPSPHQVDHVLHEFACAWDHLPGEKERAST